MQTHPKIFQASLFVAISGILYGFLGFLGVHILSSSFSLATMLFWRFCIAGLWIFLVTLVKNSKEDPLHFVSKRSLILMFFLGAIGYAGSSGFYFLASEYTGTGLAMVIFFCYPIIVAFFSWMLHNKKITRSTFVALVIIIAGLFFLRYSSVNSLSMLGILFGILSAVCYAFYVMGSKHFSSMTKDSNVLTMMVCFGCSFLFLILSISSNSFEIPHTLKSWEYFMALGVLATALPIQLMLVGLKHISSMRASIISVVEPLVTVLVGIFLLGESISHLQLLGVAIILGGALVVQFQREL